MDEVLEEAWHVLRDRVPENKASEVLRMIRRDAAWLGPRAACPQRLRMLLALIA